MNILLIQQVFIEHLLGVKHYFKCFVGAIAVNSHNYSMSTDSPSPITHIPNPS